METPTTMEGKKKKSKQMRRKKYKKYTRNAVLDTIKSGISAINFVSSKPIQLDFANRVLFNIYCLLNTFSRAMFFEVSEAKEKVF